MVSTVIFDLGGVLVEIGYQIFIENLSKEFNIPQDKIIHNSNGHVHQEFMKGNLSGEQFHDIICKKYNHFLPVAKFINIWNTILIEQNNAVAEMVKKLSSSYRIALLSNVDPWHFQYCIDHFPVMNRFKTRFLSYEMHLLKPDPEIYRRVVNILEVPPDECLFIDDLEENISGAKQAGLQAVQFINAENLKMELSESGILLPH